MYCTSRMRSTVVLLDTGTPGTSGEIFSGDAHVLYFSHEKSITVEK